MATIWAPSWIEIITIICIILCFLTTFFQMYKHLRHYNNPAYQRKIIVILLMPPIYEIFSTLTIWVNDDKGYLLLIRDIYESFVIYAFFKLLCAYVGYDPDRPTREDIDHKVCEIMGEKGPHPHQFPFNYCLKPLNLVNYQEAHKVYRFCKFGILQYIPIKIILAGLTFVAVYKVGTGVLYDICGAIEFVVVCLALYWLVFFYHIFYADLKPFRPLRKLLIIKGILFLTFWQEQVLNYCGVYMSTSRYIPPENREDADVILSCLLVDIEMVIMSILTTFAFSYKDFCIGKEKKRMRLLDIINAKLIAHKFAKDNAAKHHHNHEVWKIDQSVNKETLGDDDRISNPKTGRIAIVETKEMIELKNQENKEKSAIVETKEMIEIKNQENKEKPEMKSVETIEKINKTIEIKKKENTTIREELQDEDIESSFHKPIENTHQSDVHQHLEEEHKIDL